MNILENTFAFQIHNFVFPFDYQKMLCRMVNEHFACLTSWHIVS